jgi:hypothetical protein
LLKFSPNNKLEASETVWGFKIQTNMALQIYYDVIEIHSNHIKPKKVEVIDIENEKESGVLVDPFTKLPVQIPCSFKRCGCGDNTQIFCMQTYAYM